MAHFWHSMVLRGPSCNKSRVIRVKVFRSEIFDLKWPPTELVTHTHTHAQWSMPAYMHANVLAFIYTCTQHLISRQTISSPLENYCLESSGNKWAVSVESASWSLLHHHHCHHCFPQCHKKTPTETAHWPFNQCLLLECDINMLRTVKAALAFYMQSICRMVCVLYWAGCVSHGDAI